MVTIFSLLHIAKDPVNPLTGLKCDECGGLLYDDPIIIGGLHCEKCGKKFNKLPKKGKDPPIAMAAE